MKKLLLFLLCFSIFTFFSVSLATFLPEIDLQITIKPQHETVAEAQEARKPNCVVLYNYDVDKIADEINSLYDRGYRLKGFSTISTSIGVNPGVNIVKSYAAICQD